MPYTSKTPYLRRFKERPIACVIGDLSLVRVVGRNHIPVAVVSSTDDTDITQSKYCKEVVETPSWVDDPDGAIDALIEWGSQQSSKPVLFYQGDHDMVAISRARERLAPLFRFVLPPAELLEDLSDKLRFARLCESGDLPVPKTLLLEAGCDVRETLKDWNDFPSVFKPAMRNNWYQMIGKFQKALRLESREELEALIPKIDTRDAAFVLQAAVEGGEENIVSYHAYIRPSGETVAEFTGRKIRTYPRLYGISSYVEITQENEVRDLGRSVVKQLGFSGVLKIDFKYDQRTGELFMLEINSRFNLWHHPGAIAGVDIPAAVYQDCIMPGSAPIASKVKRKARWMDSELDALARKEYNTDGNLSRLRWIGQVASAEINEAMHLSDPVPGIKHFNAKVQNKLRKILHRPSPTTGET